MHPAAISPPVPDPVALLANVRPDSLLAEAVLTGKQRKRLQRIRRALSEAAFHARVAAHLRQLAQEQAAGLIRTPRGQQFVSILRGSS